MIEFKFAESIAKSSLRITIGFFFAFTLTACGLFGGSSESAQPVETRVPVPTFTATPVVAAPTAQPAQAEQPATPTQPPPPEATVEATVALTNTEVVPPPTVEAATITPTLEVKAQVSVTQAQVNVRSGPGTDYGLAGTVSQGERYTVVAKNAAGDWWKICCVNGQEVWIFGALVTAENVANVAVDANIPAPPVVQQLTVVPAQPTQPPAAAQPTAVPPPAASDPCAGIGGDGCKFRLKSGPAFAANSGELKLQLYFIHSGIDGGQPQGSYFVALFKDGQKLPVSDAVRSISLEKNNGSLGQYNYEFTLQLSQLPGNNVAGNYSIFVLDGNGERDSKDFGFGVPDGQGLVYIVFDQG